MDKLNTSSVTQPSRLHLACPGCLRENRVPVDRLEDNPKCGMCGVRLLDGQPATLNDENFDAYVNPNGLPILVDFWAPWCGPCRAMAPAFAQAAQKMATRTRFAKVNTDESQQVAARFAIRSIPTLVLFQGGREIKRTSGALDAGSLIRWITT